MAAPLLSLPPASKAALVAAVVVAQKPANVSTNLHEAARIEEDVSATLNAEEAENRKHGDEGMVSPTFHVRMKNPRISWGFA